MNTRIPLALCFGLAFGCQTTELQPDGAKIAPQNYILCSDDERNRSEGGFPEVYYPDAISSRLEALGVEGVPPATSCQQARTQIDSLSIEESVQSNYEIIDLGRADRNISKEPEHRIHDGEMATSFELPVVLIGFSHPQTPGLYFWCSGSIVSSQHILTAAHCAAKPGLQKVVVYTWENANSPAIFDHAKVYIHDRYTGGHQGSIKNHTAFAYDIALVGFEEEDRPEALKDPAFRSRFLIRHSSSLKNKGLTVRGHGKRKTKAQMPKSPGLPGGLPGINGSNHPIPGGPDVAGAADAPPDDHPIKIRAAAKHYFRAVASKAGPRMCKGDSGGPALYTGGKFPVIWGVFSGFQKSKNGPKGPSCTGAKASMYWSKTAGIHAWIEKQMQDDDVHGFGPDFACDEYSGDEGDYYRCW